MPTRDFYRRHLPHLQPGSGWYSITLRLADSLPPSAITRLWLERNGAIERIGAQQSKPGDPALQTRIRELYFEHFDDLLNNGRTGPRWLDIDEVASIVHEGLLRRDGEVFDLLTSTIMPNHVHVVCGFGQSGFRVGGDNRKGVAAIHGEELPLTRVFGSFKKFTARRANRLLVRTGPFWQDESYDHLIRTGEELERSIWYVLENPVKAGLVEKWSDWKWTYCKPGLL